MSREPNESNNYYDVDDLIKQCKINRIYGVDNIPCHPYYENETVGRASDCGCSIESSGTPSVEKNQPDFLK